MKIANNDLKLSILDFVHIYGNSNPSESLKNVIEMAQLAEELGYTRYWFTEHHNTKTSMSTSPELLTMHAATHTKRIRVGSGGVMLPNHSALKVMENFTLLEGLHPGRIDLGIGRASGTDRQTMLALLRSKELLWANDFPDQLDDLLSFFKRDFNKNHPFSQITPSGDTSMIPDVYMLSSSEGGLQFALDKGLGFVFAAQLAPQLAVPILRAYKNQFKASSDLSEPKSIMSLMTIVAETEEEAKFIAGPAQLMWAQISTGTIDLAFSTSSEAKNHVYTLAEESARERNKSRFIIGSAENVAQTLYQLSRDSLVDEIIIADFYPDQESRKKGHRLLAQELGLY